jgi:hypothetical protein
VRGSIGRCPTRIGRVKRVGHGRSPGLRPRRSSIPEWTQLLRANSRKAAADLAGRSGSVTNERLNLRSVFSLRWSGRRSVSLPRGCHAVRGWTGSAGRNWNVGAAQACVVTAGTRDG